MAVSLKAENVTIRYITGDFKDIGLKEYVMRRLKGNYHVKEFLAVQNVSFELEDGEMLGIIGANGAGKSTLLKAISGIMAPTRGTIQTKGEIAALLELGSGFDGDLTVKENAYLRGAMLGYTQEFMDETYEKIIDFAELREFQDRPFKQLSSGMKSRLAFSIASLVKPDILILDEVLSVGDGAFKEKSAKKMQEIIHGGATTILVSHSLDDIRSLCTKVLWLDHGRQIAFGETQEICDRYERFLSGDKFALEPPESEGASSGNQPEASEAPQEAPDASVAESAPAAMGTPGKLKRITAVDGLRGLMALIVTLFHFGQAYPLGNTFHRGYFAVEVFFALTGFLFAEKCWRSSKDSLTLGSVLREKLTHLYPAYFVSVISLVLLYSFTWFHGNVLAWLQSDSGHLPSLIAELLLLQTTGIANLVYINGPVFYVSSLLLSLLLFTVLWRLLPQKAFLFASFILSLIIYILLFIYEPYMGSESFFRSTRVPVPLMRGIAGIGLGICLFWVHTKLKDKTGSYPGMYPIAVISCIALIVPMVITEPSRTNYLLFIPASLCVISMFCLANRRRFFILDSKPVQYLGMVSYSFFVMQSFSQNVCIHHVSKITNNPVLQNCAYLTINLLLATLVWWVFEKKVPAYLKRRYLSDLAAHRKSLASIFAAGLVLSVFVVAIVSEVFTALPSMVASPTAIQLSVVGDSGNVTFRGGMIGDAWQSPNDLEIDAGSWVFDAEQATYTATDNQPLTVMFPAGSKRSLVFTAGPEEGIIDVACLGTNYQYNLYNDKLMPLGQGYSIPNNVIPTKAKAAIFLAVLLVLISVGCLSRSSNPVSYVNREMGGDIARIICCFTVVLLHSTQGPFKTCELTSKAWMAHLAMNSFTAFAVPCFYMLSGAYLLRRQHGLRETLLKRVPRLFFPLLGWSVIYILISGDISPSRFVQMLYREQATHLWFLYPIIGINLLLPGLSALYAVLNRKTKVYLLALLLVVPSLLDGIGGLTGIAMPIPHFVVLWPDLGLFMLGGFLWEYRDRVAAVRRFLPLTFLLGLGFTMAATRYISFKDGALNMAFISRIGSVGTILMAASVLLFLFSGEEMLQRIGERSKSVIHQIAQTTFVIYLIHPLVMQLWNHSRYSWLPINANEGNLFSMFISAMIYFAVCAVIADVYRKFKRQRTVSFRE